MVLSIFFNNTQLHELAKMVIKVTIVLSPEWVVRLTCNRRSVSPEFELLLFPWARNLILIA